MKNIKILDCTLRDGGYYNNWDFSKDVVSDYLKTMSKVGIEYIEFFKNTGILLDFHEFNSKLINENFVNTLD